MKGSNGLLRRAASRGIFAARWIMAPFWLGLLVALVLVLLVFLRQLATYVMGAGGLGKSEGLLMALALIDLVLVASLLLTLALSAMGAIVQARWHGESQLKWMGRLTSEALNAMLSRSIIAISAFSLLDIFMKLDAGTVTEHLDLQWMAVIHACLLLSVLILGVVEWLARHGRRSGG